MTLVSDKQEPVAWMWEDGTLTADPDFADGTWTPLYAAPLKREWVGLTVEEIDDIWKTEVFDVHYGIARMVEAKLKEKNT